VERDLQRTLDLRIAAALVAMNTIKPVDGTTCGAYITVRDRVTQTGRPSAKAV
jgi:hypothetical protein